MLYQKERAFLSGFYQRLALSTFLLFVWYFKSWGHINIFFSFLKRSVPPEKGEVGSKAVHQGGVHPRQPPHLLSDYPSHLTSVPAAQHFLFPPSCLSTHLFSTWNVLDPCPPGLICILSDLRSSQRGVPPVFDGAVSQTWWAPLTTFSCFSVSVYIRPLLVNMERTP